MRREMASSVQTGRFITFPLAFSSLMMNAHGGCCSPEMEDAVCLVRVIL